MEPGFYWAKLARSDDEWEPVKVDEDGDVWFFQDEFFPSKIENVEFGERLIHS